MSVCWSTNGLIVSLCDFLPIIKVGIESSFFAFSCLDSQPFSKAIYNFNTFSFSGSDLSPKGETPRGKQFHSSTNIIVILCFSQTRSPACCGTTNRTGSCWGGWGRDTTKWSTLSRYYSAVLLTSGSSVKQNGKWPLILPCCLIAKLHSTNLLTDNNRIFVSTTI